MLRRPPHRPKSKNAEWEDPAPEGEPFNYDAVAQAFYFEVESVGGLEPDAIIQQGIKVMQQKLAAIIQELSGGDARGGGVDGDTSMDMNGYGGPRSPELNGFGGGGGAGGRGDYDMDQGYTTPYMNGGGGGASAWGGAGGTTPYGATPYGQNGY